jgi:beta propeller repeat protein
LCRSSPPIIYVAGDGSGDLNCHGKDDQVQINQALKFVAENPGYTTVHLKGPFTYVIDDTILIGNNSILEGDSTAVIKLADHAGWPTMKPLIKQMRDRGNYNITVRGFEIDGNYAGNIEIMLGRGYYNTIYFIHTNNVKVYNMYMHDGMGDGLRINQGKNVQFYNNTIYKLGHDGLFAIMCENVEAWNNRITCRTDSGLRIWNSNKVKLHNNVIDSFHHWSAGGPGIQIERMTNSQYPTAIVNDVEVYNNTIFNAFGPGIWLIGYGKSYSKDEAKNVNIHHNIFYGTGTNPSIDGVGGIVESGFYDTLIENNVFDGVYNAAIAYMYPLDSTGATDLSPPGTGYTTIVLNNIIVNTQKRIADPNETGYGAINYYPGNSSFVLENNCLYNNVGGNYINANSTTDIYADPLFIDQRNHDYHLQSIAGRWNGKTWVKDNVSSPCIDAGYRYSDYSNEPEPNGNRINIGPDGNTMYASKSELNVQTPTLPTANFSSNVNNGYELLNVVFTDTSTGTPTSWKWSFGDGTTSTIRNPVHAYNKTGKYTVSLTVKNAAGSNTETKSNYIVINASSVQSVSPIVAETQITTNESMQEFPAIYGDRIVWQDFRNGNLENGNWDIYMYNLSTSKETRINVNESWQEEPKIYADSIVWEDGRNGNYDIYMYNLSTSNETRVTTDESDNIHPVIYGDKIVWEKGHNEGNYDIYMYNISTHKETQITTTGKAHFPTIFGDKIVWENGSNEGNYDIYMYNISTHKETQITTSRKARHPTVYGDKIVWEDYRLADESPDVFMYDLSTRKETQISTSGIGYNSAIYGDRIVWQDFRNGNDDIYTYNISTFKEIQITTNKSEQEFPAIYGDRIVWQDFRNRAYNPNIYMATISEVGQETIFLIADFSADPKSGYAPLDVQFTDNSQGATGWNWNFGDGATSTQQNPMHTYSAAGNYTVALTASNENGSASKTAPIIVQIQSNSSGKGSKKTPGFEDVCGIVSLLAVVLHKRK